MEPASNYLNLQEIESGEYPLERTLRLGDLRDEQGCSLLAGPVLLRGEATRGSRGVELRAEWRATVRLRCSRCLDSFEREAGERFFLILVGEASEFGAAEQEITADDAALFPVQGGRADLGRIAAEQIVLNLPLKPVCGPDCAGLCPTCGANRNAIQCECRESEVDPRLAPLQQLKERLVKERLGGTDG